MRIWAGLECYSYCYSRRDKHDCYSRRDQHDCYSRRDNHDCYSRRDNHDCYSRRDNHDCYSGRDKHDCYSRRDNLVLRGVLKDKDEDAVKCVKVSHKFFVQHLTIPENVANAMIFVRCHRLGTSKNAIGQWSREQQASNIIDRVKKKLILLITLSIIPTKIIKSALHAVKVL